jgi:hypothetical protein
MHEGADDRGNPEPSPGLILLTKRQFQLTFGFWFMFATINGFCGGLAFAVIAHTLGWWSC